MAVGRIGRRNALMEINDLAQVVAGHTVRIAHTEEAVKACPLNAHGEALAGHTVALQNLGQRMEAQEKTLTGMRNWLIGVLASSVGTLAVLLWQTLQHGK
jgi:hypothetical protein